MSLFIGDQSESFFAALFDFSFRHMIAPRIAGILFMLAIAGGAIMSLYDVGMAFDISVGAGLATLFILVPIGFSLYVIFVRVALEAVIAMVRVAENTTELLETQTRRDERSRS